MATGVVTSEVVDLSNKEARNSLTFEFSNTQIMTV
jgi:hypothetical protein